MQDFSSLMYITVHHLPKANRYRRRYHARGRCGGNPAGSRRRGSGTHGSPGQSPVVLVLSRVHGLYGTPRGTTSHSNLIECLIWMEAPRWTPGPTVFSLEAGSGTIWRPASGWTKTKATGNQLKAMCTNITDELHGRERLLRTTESFPGDTTP
jgi:hypothetical protein